MEEFKETIGFSPSTKKEFQEGVVELLEEISKNKTIPRFELFFNF